MDHVEKKPPPFHQELANGFPQVKGPLVHVQFDPWFEDALALVVGHCKQSMHKASVHDEQLEDAVHSVESLLIAPTGHLKGLVYKEDKDAAKVNESDEWALRPFLGARADGFNLESESGLRAPQINRQYQIATKLDKLEDLKSPSSGAAGSPVVIQLDPQVHEALFLLLHHCLESALNDYAECIDEGFGVDWSLSEFFDAIKRTKEFLKVPYGNLNDVMHGPGEPRAANWASDLFARKQAQRSEPRNKSLEDAHNSPYASLEFREFITSPGFKRFVTSQQQREGQYASRVEQQSARHHDHLVTPRQDPSKTR